MRLARRLDPAVTRARFRWRLRRLLNDVLRREPCPFCGAAHYSVHTGCANCGLFSLISGGPRELTPVSIEDVSPYLRGAVWHWARWHPSEAVIYDPKTGSEEPAIWDHDHCHFCHARFSDEVALDVLHEGWAAPGPAGRPRDEWDEEYHWVCSDCFARLRDRFRWHVESGRSG